MACILPEEEIEPESTILMILNSKTLPLQEVVINSKNIKSKGWEDMTKMRRVLTILENSSFEICFVYILKINYIYIVKP